MIIIKYNKFKRKYVKNKVPLFKSKKDEIIWFKNEKINMKLNNIKCIYIDTNDIKKMKNIKDDNLCYLYKKYYDFLDKTDYIKIINNDSNKQIIYNLLNTNWLLILNDLITKNEDEIKTEYDSITKNIINLTTKKTPPVLKSYIDNSVLLLNYKKDCLNNYLSNENERKKIKTRKFK